MRYYKADKTPKSIFLYLDNLRVAMIKISTEKNLLGIKQNLPQRRRGTERNICVALLFSVSLCLCGKAFAEDRYSLLGNLKDDFTYVASSPARMDRKSTAITLGIIATGAFIYTQDEKIRDFFQSHQKSSSMDGLSDIAEKFGNGVYELPLLALYGGGGYLIENEKMQDTSLLSFESFLVANTIGTAAKIGIGRPRPYTEEGSGSYKPFSTDSDHTSMPSGHTISAFSIASVFADEYDDKPMVGVTAYGLASMVAFQRVYDDKHWASDVFAGAVLGTVIGKSVVYLHKDKKMENVHIIPISIPSEGYYGVTAVVRF